MQLFGPLKVIEGDPLSGSGVRNIFGERVRFSFRTHCRCQERRANNATTAPQHTENEQTVGGTNVLATVPLSRQS